MGAYVVRRLLLILPTLWLVTMIVFLSVRFIPGSVIDLMVAEMAQESGLGTELNAEYIRKALGLDLPVYQQYGKWLGVWPNTEGNYSGVLQGTLGDSLWTGRPVIEEIAARLPVSFELGFLAMIVALLIAIPIGVYSAIRQDTIGDYGGRTFAILCISVPSFWLGTMVVVYPSIWWNWAPPMEYIPLIRHGVWNPGENFLQFIIPAGILGMVLSGVTMRMTRTMMLEVLRQDYIRTAWAKGLTEWTIITRHVLKNALIPVVTIVGLQLPILIGGSVILEQIFVLPGIGRLMIEAINKRDYTIISGINVILAIAVLFANLTVDITYAYLDPRVHYR